MAWHPLKVRAEKCEETHSCQSNLWHLKLGGSHGHRKEFLGKTKWRKGVKWHNSATCCRELNLQHAVKLECPLNTWHWWIMHLLPQIEGWFRTDFLKVGDEHNQLSEICRSPAVFYIPSQMKVHFKQWWQGSRRGEFLRRAAFSTSQGFEVCPHQFRFTHLLTGRVWSQQPPWLLNTPACICSNLQLWSKNRDNSHAHYSAAKTWMSDACTVNRTTHVIKVTQQTGQLMSLHDNKSVWLSGRAIYRQTAP